MNRKSRESVSLLKICVFIYTAVHVSCFDFEHLTGQQKEKEGGLHDVAARFQQFLNAGQAGREMSHSWVASVGEKSGSSSSGQLREIETRAFSGEGDASYSKSKSYYGSKSSSGRASSSRGHGAVYDGGCRNRPESAENVVLRCSLYSGCHAVCHRNYQFPNGETGLFVSCKHGEWQIERVEWEKIPPCAPICLPACQHNGICIAPNQCNCPENYRGPQCQFENKPCLNLPPMPANSKRICSALSCTLECAPNHQFSDGSTITNMVCKDGNWVPSRPDWVTIPDCEVICQPPCMNGGICLSFNMCQCPRDFRGPQCQYSADSCSAQKLGFNGGYNCTASGTSFSCSLSCPPGIEFESPPVPIYTCDFATGRFSPSPIPQCKYGSHFKVISPFEDSSYESNSSHRYGMGMYGKGIKTHGVSQGMIPQTFIPDILVMEEKKPKSGSCFTWGNAHYKTFDGKVYDFTSSCLYTFVRDAMDNTFSVSLSNNKGCYSEEGCYRNVTVFIEDREYVLAIDAMGDAMMALNGFQRIAIPSKTREFTIESVANFIILNLHSCGVTIRWNTKDFVQVDVSERMWNKTAGLCGRIDGHPGNDLEKIDGSTPTSILEFANSWEVHELGNECTDSPSDLNACSRDTIEDVNLVSKAEQFCHKLLNDPKFDACRKVVNVMRYYEACKWDYCACEKSNPVDCGCQAISVFVQECSRNGVTEIANWRDEMTCPIACENGKIYLTCGPAVQETCGTVVETLSISSAEPSSCVEGCFCPTGTLLHDGKCIPRSQCPCQLRGKQFPPGETVPSDCNTCICEDGKWACTQVQCGARCASIGDPHYTTFDGRHYNFMGKCSYYLVKGDTYSIEAENVACAGSISEAMNFPAAVASGLPSCTKMITIHHSGQTIKLKQNREVSINGEEITKVPFVHQGIKIRMVSSIFLLVELPNGLEVWWDGMTRAYIDAPAHLQGKTKGLCGTFNTNQKDDFLTPEGDVEQSAISFANKWKTSESCADLPEKFLERPCDVYVHKKATAESHCQKLKGNIFQICHWLVDPEPFYQDCLYDVCSCEGKIGPCMCPILSAYAKECAKQGINLDWRMEIRECGIQCPGNQKYQVCGNTCTRSCFDISNRVGDTPCKRKCAEGCNCPEGETLDSRGECIPISACPCLQQGLQFQPGHKLIMPGARESQLCICENGLWDCHHATDQDMKDYPTVESLRVTCSSVNNEEFTDCEPAEPVTCKNMHKPPSHSPAKCSTGCKCKKGYVLDTYSKKCIKPSECPCHHGGRSYGELEKIQEDCNTCTCNSGKWNCTESACAGICSGWGESHYKTFDGKIFDFHGSCDYVFAKGKLNKQNSFEVMIQNVPCGSSGIACSKAVTLKVGSGDKAEAVTFSKDQGLPPYGGLKRISIRQAGLFVFAEVADLGVVLQWDKGTRIYVKANPSWKNKIRGLCGNYNDNENDDFMTPSGGISEISPVVFGDSWKVHQYCPETYEVKDTCAIHPSRKVWALQKCGILKSEVFQPCHSEVPLDPYLERCIFDTCGCDMGGDCECLCTAVAAYAQECNIRGVPIKWRSQELCPMQCDESCAHYSPCVQTCPQQTCDNQYIYKSLTQLCNEDSCVEGCELKPCPEGEVYQSLEDLKCVPLASCKTVCMTVGNQTYFEGDKMEGDDCYSCFCSRHEKTCKGKPCPLKEQTTTEYTTIYTTTPKYSTTLEQTTTSEKPSTTEHATTPPREAECITGWSPWISNDKPQGLKKPTDIEEISTISSHLVKKHKAICEPENMIKIECRVVGMHANSKETGQNVLCSLESGLICEPLHEKGKVKPCLDYEIRVFCSCESKTTTPITKLPEPFSTVSLSTVGEPVCITGWSPWFSNDRPVRFTKKFTDIERIPDRISSKPHASCERSQVAKIECRTVGTEKTFDETGQNVRCNLEEGLVCHSSKGAEAVSCLNYEIRVFCLCESTTSVTALPTSTTTESFPNFSLSTVGEPVCITGWSPWFSNDRPVRFTKKYTDIEGIPDRISSKPHASCERSQVAKIECRTVGTEKTFDETGQNVRCNLEEGLVCHPSKGAEAVSCLNYEIRVFCLCESTTSVTALPTSTTPEPFPTFSLSTVGEPVCITGWSPWFSNDRPVRFTKKYTDIEGIPDRISSKPHASCERSQVAKIECRTVGTEKTFDETGQNVRCNLEEGLVCHPSKGAEAVSCLNYEIRVFCLCESTTSVTALPTSTTPEPFPTFSLSTVGEPVCITGWSPWFSNDRPVRFTKKYTDIEGIPNRISSKPYASCERSQLADIECRTVGTEKTFDETGQNVRCNLEEGLVCHPSKGAEAVSCLNYEIRVFCLCETKGTTEFSTVSVTPSVGICQEGLGMETGAIKDDQISVSSISTPGHLGNHARLHGDGAWIPESFEVPNEWIQVDLLSLKEITGVIIQGNPSGRDWVKTFEVKWSDDGDFWNTIRNEDDGPPKEFQGNSDALTPKKVLFGEPVFAQYIKVIPTDFHNRISLRLEVLGCDIKETTTTTTKSTTSSIPEVCDPAHPNHPHESDCHIFYHCADMLLGIEMVEKTCGTHMMYNPETQVCDWPANVMKIRPDCSEIKVPPTPAPCKEGWTEWINISNPKHGNGDYETLINIKKHFNTNICGSDEHIFDIECKFLKAIPRKSIKKTKTSTKSGRKMEYQLVDFEEAKQVVTCRKDVGLLCNNHDQWGRMCMDYSVRFYCGCEKKVTVPTVMETKPTASSTTSVCPPGKVWKDCAIRCNQVCLHFEHILSEIDLCSDKYECVSGCVDEREKSCPKGYYWRDYDTCLEIGDCTCVSHSGRSVKPGEVFKESDCEVCQCENNVYTCDKSACKTSTTFVSTVSSNVTSATTTTPFIYTVTVPTEVVGTGRSRHRCDIWTSWHDDSNPEGTEGDFESVESLRKNYLFCDHPSDIQCVTTNGNIPFDETGNEVTCDLENGLQCYNMNNIPGGCADYKIRIFCSCEETVRVTPGIETTTETGPSITPVACDRWSDWINDSDKLITHGMEHEHKTVEQLHDMGFCRDGEVVEIECKDVKTGMNYDATWDVGVSCSLENGLLCRNDEQRKGLHCRDYKIRYFCSCGKIIKTTVTTIITSTVTPPPECDRERFIPLINGPYPLSDAAFSASSTKSPKHGPQSARLQSPYSTESGSGWIPFQHNKDQFLQVDLGRDEPIYGIKVQGSEDVPDMYVTSYHVLHSEDGHKFKYAEDISGNPKLFRGPVNNFKPIEEVFVEPFEARYVRVNPQTWNNGISLKVDLIGCGEVPVTTTTPWIKLTTPSSVICIDEMGLENGVMNDEQIEVSSVFDDGERFSAPNIRLRKPQTDTKGGAWIPASNSINEWVKFDFLEPRNLTGVITQGQNGGDSWVESFNVMYSHDGKVWNPVLGSDGTEKEFIANFDADTPQENYFERPIQAQYLKIKPLLWHNNIAIRAEVLGCFHPYPPITTTEPVITTIKTTEDCKPCPNLPFEKLENCVHCSDGLIWDGSSCVDKSECQCYVGHIPYSVGAVYTTEDCEQCICKIGGVSSCHEIKCPKCDKDQRIEMSPQCGCVCKPCPANTRICPSTGICIAEELWCDGIENCPDDEINCTEATTPTVSTTAATDCPIPVCPPEYKPVLSKVTLEFEEPYSTKKGTKGRKGVKERVRTAKAKAKKLNCPIYECVPALTTTPDTCPTPECPDGFNLQVMEFSEGASNPRCPLFKCVLKPPEEVMCNMNGRGFETFDGIDYNYDICHHILATDSINGKWRVEVHKNCSSCPFYLVIKQDLHTVILDKDIIVKYGPYSYTREQAKKIGYKNNQFEVSKVGDILHFKSNQYGFWVNWDGKSNARILVFSKLLNGVSGLCGYYSNDKDDDKQMPDGTIARTYKEFGDSWVVSGYEDCEAKVCPVELQNKAWEICSLARNKPFMECNEVINVEKFISQCLETVCVCLEEKQRGALKEGIDLGLNWEDECRCDALLTFATQCKEKEPSFDLSEWRVVHSCPALCPPGEVYKDCFKRQCELSCGTLMIEDACPVLDDTCFSGCFCSDGLVRKGDLCVEPSECRDCNCDCFGDPHYFTFDRTNYTFNGNCTYVAARDIKPGGKHDFQVLARNRECIEKTKATCTQAVTILYGEHYIHLERIEEDGEIAAILDGKILKSFPNTNEWSKLERLGGKEVTVLIPSIQLEVSYFFNNYAFVIRLPSHLYGDNTEGLCGNCNKNKKDDLKRSDGSVTDDIDDFGKSWLTKLPPELGFGEEEDCKVPVVLPCPLLPPDEDQCLNSIMEESRFGVCHPVVNPAPYVESCSKDICHSSDKKKTVCQTLEAYARECAREGICLDWNVNDLCPYECPAGLVYHPCGSGCLETCENHESFQNKSSLCSMSSIDGCYCPTGKVWKENKCVEVTMCRACDEDGHFSGDVWNPSECEECSCTDSTVTCKVKTCPSVETICDSSLTAVKVSESEDECCPKYICEPESTPSPSCEEPMKPECGYGQEMKITTSISGCREYICVCVPLEKCEPLITSETLEADYDDDHFDPALKYVMDKSGCCPKMISKCDLSLCSPPPECPVHHTVVEIPPPESKCCPDYACSPSSEVCMYEHEYASGEELETNEGQPIRSFRKPGERWHDGPCRECTCAEEEEEDFSKGTKGLKGKVKGARHVKKVFKASCETIRCQSAEEHPDSREYLLKEVPVPGKCCPEILRTACQDEGKVYQVGKEWSQPGEHCISHQCVLSTNASLVIKQFKIQHCNKECDEGWEYQEPPPHSEKCCGQCKQVACMSGGKLHPVGSSWVSSDHCTTYYCREVDGVIQTQSVDVNCPKEERLYEDFKVEVLPIEGSCCNKTFKVACLIGEHELKEGETFMVSKCKKVYCALDADNGLSKQEMIESCNKECQQGWEYIEPVLDSAKCCGECKQVACITEDNKLIPPGSKWTTNDGCITHLCEQKGEQLQIATSEEKCPAVDDCPPENVFFDKCCKRCNTTEKCPPQGLCAPADMEPELTVGLVDERKESHGRCINPDPVPGFKECKGNCHSSTFFDLRTLTHQANCKCCQATTTKSITVNVVCEDGFYYERKVTTPTGCTCNPCESPEKIRTPTKKGTKSGFKSFSLKDADA